MKAVKILTPSGIIMVIAGYIFYNVGENMGYAYLSQYGDYERNFGTPNTELYILWRMWDSISDAALIVAISGGVLLALALLIFIVLRKKAKNSIDSPADTPRSNNQTSDPGPASLSEKLSDLEKTKAAGLITQEEYNELRKRYIDSQFSS